ncbi:26S proteasome non-ATPase regulatory subunit 5 [Chlamydoabsidia padenii]|nr:26S proteasome non-ATPase regulatory subunit 5 [Chlamydoabsidia padenii]
MPSIESPLERAQKALTSNTSNEEKRLAVVTLLTTLGDSLTPTQAQHILTLLPLSQLYGVLSTCADNDDTDTNNLTTALCDLINKLLGPFPYSVVSQGENKIYLEQGLQHFSPVIRHLSLRQVEKSLASTTESIAMVDSDILPMVVTTIAFQDTRTACKAADILEKVCLTNEGCEHFFQSSATQFLQAIMQVNGTYSFRVYDLIMKIAGHSDHAFRLCESSGILARLLEELNTDDLLLRMNAIELLNEVAATASGYQFLNRAQLLDKLTAVLDMDDDQDVALVLTKCAIIKLLGSLGENKDVNFSTIQQGNHVLERLERYVDCDNKEIQTVALASIGLIGCHLNGLRLLQTTNMLMEKLYQLARTASGDIKVVLLQSFSKLVGVSDIEQSTEEVEQRTLSVYQSIPGGENGNGIRNLMNLVKQPVENLRIAGFALLVSIASHKWGRQEISQCFEFLGYLLDRSNEYTESGQVWKYAVVKMLVEGNTDAESTLGRHYPLLTQYVRQGPYYQPTQVTTAMESG